MASKKGKDTRVRPIKKRKKGITTVAQLRRAIDEHAHEMLRLLSKRHPEAAKRLDAELSAIRRAEAPVPRMPGVAKGR